MVSEISEVTGEGRRREDVGAGFEVEAEASGLCVEPHEARAVGGSGIDHAIAHGRRGDYPRFAGGIVPLLAAGSGIDGVDVRIAATDVNSAIDHGWRGLEANLVVDGIVLAALERPFFLARVAVDRIEVAVPAADVNNVVHHRRRRMDNIFS